MKCNAGPGVARAVIKPGLQRPRVRAGRGLHSTHERAQRPPAPPGIPPWQDPETGRSHLCAPHAASPSPTRSQQTPLTPACSGKARGRAGRDVGVPHPGRGRRRGTVAWASKEFRCAAAVVRGDARTPRAGTTGKGVCGAAGAAGPTSCTRAKAARPTPAAPRAGPAGREHPGEPTSGAAPSVRSTAAGTPRPHRPPPWSSCPSRLGSGRACPRTPLASALAQPAPLAGRYVPCQQHAKVRTLAEMRQG